MTQESYWRDSIAEDEAMDHCSKNISQKNVYCNSWTDEQIITKKEYNRHLRQHTEVNENPAEHSY